MPATRKKRRIKFHPGPVSFMPDSKDYDVRESVDLTHEELEALRLKHVRQLNQTECAHLMNTSQSTFQRILNGALKKISAALVKKKAIRIHGEGCSCRYI